MGKVAVIDVGTTKIVTIIGESTEEGKLKILKWKQSPSEGIERGNVVNILPIVERIKENIKDFADIMPENKEFYVGMAGQNLRVERVKYEMGFAERVSINKDIVEKLKNKAKKIEIDPDEEIFLVLASSFVIDNDRVVKNPIKEIAKSSIEGDFLVFIAKTTNLANLKTSIQNAGINIKTFCLEPIASAEAVLRSDEKKSCVAILDIGGGTSDLAVYENNKLIYVAVLPIGGQYITNSLAEKFSINKELAEEIKKNIGLDFIKDTIINNKATQKTIKTEDIFYNIRDSYKKIFSSLLYHLNYIQRKENIKELIITGGGAATKNISQMAQFYTNYEVRIAGPNLKIDNQEHIQLQEPQFSTAIGLLLLAKQYQNEEVIELKEKEKENKNEIKEKKEKKQGVFSSFFDKITDKIME